MYTYITASSTTCHTLGNTLQNVLDHNHVFLIHSASDVDFIKRSTEQELLHLFNFYDTLMEQKQDLENKLDDADDINLPAVYLSPRDRQILDWHFANLEFANASQLRTLSLRHWDQDDDFEFTGAHLCLRDGYDALPKALAKGVDSRLNTAVTAIHYSSDGMCVCRPSVCMCVSASICLCLHLCL